MPPISLGCRALSLSGCLRAERWRIIVLATSVVFTFRDVLAFAKFHNDLEPARFGPVLVQDRKAPAYERMHRFFSQAIRSAAAPQRFTGMLPRANAWQPTKQYAAH